MSPLDAAPDRLKSRLIVGLVFATGIIAAMQLGRIGAYAAVLRAELGLDGAAFGLAVSAITAGCAALGIVASRWFEAFGLKWVLAAGIALIGLGALGGATAASVPTLIALRFAEGLGYLGVVVTAPALIALGADPRDRSAALALWSSFVPVGLALAAALAALAPEAWRVAFGLHGAVALAAGVIVAVVVPSPLKPNAHGAVPKARMPVAGWWLGASMAVMAGAVIAFLSLYPLVMIDTYLATAEAAAVSTAVVSVASVAGSILIGVLLARRASRLVILGISAVMPIGLLAPLVPGLSAPVFEVIAVLVSIASGVAFGVLFAAIPGIAERPGEMSLVTGAVALFGSLGSLLMPPIAGALQVALGVPATLVTLAVLTALGLIALDQACGRMRPTLRVW
jgi:MFS family permease